MITRLAQARRDADEWLEKAADKQVDQLLVHVNWMKLFSDLLRDAADLLCEEGDGWQPIETAPKGVPVLVVWRRFGAFVLRQNDDGVWMDEEDSSYARPTHWMPLPAPPLAADDPS